SNIIPSEVYVEGTLRSYTPAARYQLAEEVENIFKMSESLGGSSEFYLERGEPALNNDSDVNARIEQAVKRIESNLHIHWSRLGMGGEDFGYMTEKEQGAMCFLGCAVDDEVDRGLDRCVFDVDEQCWTISDGIFVETANNFLNT